jgi:uncharacterized protein (TIGR03000 family)
MSRIIGRLLAFAVLSACVAPAYAGGGKGGKGGKGSSDKDYYSSHHGHTYYHRHHLGNWYHGAWPYGYFDYDSVGPAVVSAIESEDESPADIEEEEQTAPSAIPATVRIRTSPLAKVWFDGKITNQTGALRTFATPELEPGKTYTYGVKACWMDDGRPVWRSRKLTVVAGATTELDLR